MIQGGQDEFQVSSFEIDIIYNKWEHVAVSSHNYKPTRYLVLSILQ
jgi:hypothetical protein